MNGMSMSNCFATATVVRAINTHTKYEMKSTIEVRSFGVWNWAAFSRHCEPFYKSSKEFVLFYWGFILTLSYKHLIFLVFFSFAFLRFRFVFRSWLAYDMQTQPRTFWLRTVWIIMLKWENEKKNIENKRLRNGGNTATAWRFKTVLKRN